jgi:hypothetical protein
VRAPGQDRWPAAWAVAYVVTHHLGLLPGADAGGGTRWNDWLDVLLPYAVVGTALLALAAAGTDRRGWVVAVFGSVLYAQGHGVHLAANSIGNARGDAAPVHLWDEVVGHGLWYAGFAVLVAVLARARPDVRTGPVAVLLALGVGATWASNAAGADSLVPPALVVALAFVAHGARERRTGAGRLLLVAFAPAAAGLLAALVV